MKYEEIINHSHYEPKRHPRMSREMRAGQFAPYAALSGHAGAIRRTAKLAEYRSRRVIETNADDVNYGVVSVKNPPEKDLRELRGG